MNFATATPRSCANPDLVAELRSLAREGTVTLVYAVRDETHNHAIVLRDVLLGR